MVLHVCDAIVVSCIDFRFQKYIRDWLDEYMRQKTFDYVGFAGGSKDSDTVLKQIAISVKLHHIKQVVLMNHEDCGAYGAEGNPQRHTEDLRNVKTAIQTAYPDLQVDLYYLHLNGEFEKISNTMLAQNGHYQTSSSVVRV